MYYTTQVLSNSNTSNFLKKISATTQLLEQRLRDVNSQLIQLKQSMDVEVTERIKTDQSQADLYVFKMIVDKLYLF